MTRLDSTADADEVAAFLARRDGEDFTADVVVLCGSAVLAAVDAAAEAVRRQRVPRVLVTGGIGHSTGFLYDAVRDDGIATAGRTEASIFAELLRDRHGVEDAAITVEEVSTNCGENARFSADILGNNTAARSLLLVQDPTMQRRTHACFERCLRGAPIRVHSQAPFVPHAETRGVTDDDGRIVWSHDRFLSLLLGEIRRLADTPTGYGPLGAGFIDHIEIPEAVTRAHDRLADAHPELVRR